MAAEPGYHDDVLLATLPRSQACRTLQRSRDDFTPPLMLPHRLF